MKKVLIVSAILCLSASVALAEPPSTINFQGNLKQTGGGGVADGTYSIVFTLYTQAVGGPALWSEAQSVTVSGSLFDTILGVANPLTVVPFDAQYWLGIKVGVEPEMTPRIALTAVPYAMNVADGTVVKSLQGLQDDINLIAGTGIEIISSGQEITINSSGGGMGDADWSISGANMSSLPTGNVGIGTTAPEAKLNVNGVIKAGTGSSAGEFQSVTGTGASGSVFGGNLTGEGGRLELRSEAGSITTLIEPDGSGQGGSMTIMRNNVSPGIMLDGSSGTGSSLLMVGTSSVELRSDVSGDASVSLPSGAINPSETNAEAGAASAKAATTGALGLTTSVAALTSRTIVAPADGYVLAMSSCEVSIDLFNNTTFTTLGLTENPTVLPDNQDINVYLSNTIGNGLYVVPQSNTALFPVNAGNNTIYLSGSKNNTTPCTVRDIQLTLVFIPTAYGTIQTPNAGVAGPEPKDAVATRGPLTAGELAAERTESEEFNQLRLATEMRDMQARLVEMQREIENPNISSAGGQ